MRNRCDNPANNGYRLYGARGIGVCDRWRDSFEAFFEDMGARPEGTSLDRIDNDGWYEPSNCRWATPVVQTNNTRRNLRLTVDGVTKTIAEWSRETGIEKGTIQWRYHHGWTPEKCLGQGRFPKIKFEDEIYTLEELAKKVGVSIWAMKRRYRQSHDIEHLTKPNYRHH